jgi:riboflavin biosynthesis pyrimidine reductase
MEPAIREFLLSVLPSPNVEKIDREGRKIPTVTLTFAQSLDGKIAGRNGTQLILSGPDSMLMTHWYRTSTDQGISFSHFNSRMRAMHDAIVVGVGTALNDDPQLNGKLAGRLTRILCMNLADPSPLDIRSGQTGSSITTPSHFGCTSTPVCGM